MRFAQRSPSIFITAVTRSRDRKQRERTVALLRSFLLGSRPCDSRAALGSRAGQMLQIGIGYSGVDVTFANRPSSGEAQILLTTRQSI
jgi:hypothetical protein